MLGASFILYPEGTNMWLVNLFAILRMTEKRIYRATAIVKSEFGLIFLLGMTVAFAALCLFLIYLSN